MNGFALFAWTIICALFGAFIWDRFRHKTLESLIDARILVTDLTEKLTANALIDKAKTKTITLRNYKESDVTVPIENLHYSEQFFPTIYRN